MIEIGLANSRMKDYHTYRKGFSAPASDLPVDLQSVSEAIGLFVMPAAIAAASGTAFAKTCTPTSGWAQKN